MKWEEIKNQEQFDEWIETDDGQEYCNSYFAYLMFECDYGSTPRWDEAINGALFDVPYWIEEHSDDDTKKCQYVPGIFEPLNYGDIETIDGIDYKYIDSIGLGAETEHQLENGELVYEYRGDTFVRIFQIVE